jgi:hypothetical protein
VNLAVFHLLWGLCVRYPGGGGGVLFGAVGLASSALQMQCLLLL